MTLKGRLGLLLIILGLLSFLLFYGTVKADDIQLRYCLWGIFGLLVGGLLISKGRVPPQPDERFRTIRRAQDKFRQRRTK